MKSCAEGNGWPIRAAQALLLFLVFAVPLVMWNGTLTAAGVKFLFIRATAPALPILFLLDALVNRRLRIPQPAVLLAAGLYAALSLSSYLTTPYGDLEVLADVGIGMLLLFLVPLVFSERSGLERFLAAWLLAAALASGYYLLQLAGIDFVKWEWLANQTLGSTMANRDHLMFYLLCTAPLSAYLLTSRRPACRSLAAVFLVLAVPAVVLSGSRAAPAVLALTVPVYLLILRARSRSPAVRIALTAAILASAAGLAYAGVATCVAVTRSSPAQLSALTHLRLDMWAGAAAMVREHPVLGLGVGSFPALFGAYRPGSLGWVFDQTQPLLHAHNEFLEVAAETGLVGLGLFAALSGLIIIGGARRLKAPVDGASVTVYAAIAVLSALLFSSVSVAPRFQYCSIFYWMAAGLCLWSTMDAKTVLLTTRLRRAGILAAVGVGVAAGLAGERELLRGFVSAVYLKRSLEHSSVDARSPAARAAVEQALAWRPGSLPARYQRACLSLSAQQYDLALMDLRGFQRKSPHLQDIHFLLGTAYHAKREYAAAKKELEQTIRFFPAHQQANLLLAECSYYLGELEEAGWWCDRLLMLDSRHPKALFLKQYVKNAIAARDSSRSRP